MEWHHWVRDVILQAAAGIDHDVLDDITDSHSPSDLLIQTHLHHAEHRAAVPLDQPIDGVVVARFGTEQQLLGLVIGWPHGWGAVSRQLSALSS
jgi:hypothetical protein